MSDGQDDEYFYSYDTNILFKSSGGKTLVYDPGMNEFSNRVVLSPRGKGTACHVTADLANKIRKRIRFFALNGQNPENWCFEQAFQSGMLEKTIVLYERTFDSPDFDEDGFSGINWAVSRNQRHDLRYCAIHNTPDLNREHVEKLRAIDADGMVYEAYGVVGEDEPKGWRVELRFIFHTGFPSYSDCVLSCDEAMRFVEATDESRFPDDEYIHETGPLRRLRYDWFSCYRYYLRDKILVRVEDGKRFSTMDSELRELNSEPEGVWRECLHENVSIVRALLHIEGRGWAQGQNVRNIFERIVRHAGCSGLIEFAVLRGIVEAVLFRLVGCEWLIAITHNWGGGLKYVYGDRFADTALADGDYDIVSFEVAASNFRRLLHTQE